MKLILENIGKIKKAEIDLDHQLTVFFGPNNTGKTYVSYCLYGLGNFSPFMGARGDLDEDIDKLIQIDFQELYQKGIVEVELEKTLFPIRGTLREKYAKEFRTLLPYLFGNYEVDFSNSSIFLSWLESDNDFNDFVSQGSFKSKELGGAVKVSFYYNKEKKAFIIELDNEFDRNDVEFDVSINETLKELLLERIFDSRINDAIFIPAERIGVSVFGKDILRRRFEKSNLPYRKNELFSYSSIIETAILDQDSLNRIKHGKNKYSLIAEEIEKEILGGELTVNDSGEILYNNVDVKSLSIRNSASTIKSLSSLVFYLRYFVQYGETLFIDEPEINLHPDNQIKIARILAKISNLGINVYVSTHSDYIIREFNNLIMLGKGSPETERLMNEYGYKKDEILDHNGVGAYLFKTDGVVECVEVKETGLEMKGIDDTINNQNKASNDIMWTLFDE